LVKTSHIAIIKTNGQITRNNINAQNRKGSVSADIEETFSKSLILLLCF
jgi:hypothetical protein